MGATPELIENIRNIITDETWKRRVALPARVESFDIATGTVSVKPTILIPQNDEEQEGGIAYEDAPVISGVPVLYPYGKGAYITYELERGDFVLLIFADASIDDWKETGGIGVQPEDDRRHDISDAIAIPGIRPRTDPLNITTSLIIEHLTSILLGAGATDFVALAALVLAELNDIRTRFDLHTHGGVTTGPGVSGIPVALMGAASSVAASKVKAE